MYTGGLVKISRIRIQFYIMFKYFKMARLVNGIPHQFRDATYPIIFEQTFSCTCVFGVQWEVRREGVTSRGDNLKKALKKIILKRFRNG